MPLVLAPHHRLLPKILVVTNKSRRHLELNAEHNHLMARQLWAKVEEDIKSLSYVQRWPGHNDQSRGGDGELETIMLGLKHNLLAWGEEGNGVQPPKVAPVAALCLARPLECDHQRWCQ